jgi:dTDP-4-amino-4,6-dideoxygalactose transaminase
MTKQTGLEGFLVFGAPDIQQPEIDEVVDTLASGWLGTGPKVARFERDFAAYKGLPADHVAAVNSCTAALHVSMIAAGLGPGDEVITTPMTFCATINAIIHAGATPVLADIDPVTMNIDPAAVAAKITPRTKAILPVHFAGRPCEMDALMDLAKRHGLRVIEDAAHAIETEYHGRKAGTFGDFGCFSFYVTKNVATGEGGMVTARHEEDIHRIKTLSLHGMTKDAWHRFGDKGFRHYQVVEAGFKYNMMDLQAAIGLHQLARVEDNWLRRREIWNTYQQAFTDLPVGLPAAPADNTRHACHLYTLSIEKKRAGVSRDAMLAAMTKAQIGVGVHYTAIPEHPFYQSRFGWSPDEVPHASHIGRSTITLPLSPRLSDSDVARVCDAIKGILHS